MADFASIKSDIEDGFTSNLSETTQSGALDNIGDVIAQGIVDGVAQGATNMTFTINLTVTTASGTYPVTGTISASTTIQ